jgi:hypothetical protein
VSPQFHVAFDPTFDTVKDMTTRSMWQVRAGFVTQREPTNHENRPEKTTDPATAIAPPPQRPTTGSNKGKGVRVSQRSRLKEQVAEERGNELQQTSEATDL